MSQSSPRDASRGACARELFVYSARTYLGLHAVCFQREISVCVVSRLAGHGQAWRGAGWGVGSKIDDLGCSTRQARAADIDVYADRGRCRAL